MTREFSFSKLSVPRKKPEAVTAGSKILISGGELKKLDASDMLGGYSSTVDILDVSNMKWTTANLSIARQYFGAASATPNLAVFAGGFYNDIRLSSVDIYDAETDSWSLGKSLSHNRSNLAASTVENRYRFYHTFFLPKVPQFFISQVLCVRQRQHRCSRQACI